MNQGLNSKVMKDTFVTIDTIVTKVFFEIVLLQSWRNIEIEYKCLKRMNTYRW